MDVPQSCRKFVNISTVDVLQFYVAVCKHTVMGWMCCNSVQQQVNMKRRGGCVDVSQFCTRGSQHARLSWICCNSEAEFMNVHLCWGFWTYSGRGKFMPLPLKSKILETPGFIVTDYIKMFPLWIQTLNLQASLMVQCELSRICNYSSTCPQSKQT